MLEIPLFVLVIQIGFNAALNDRGYSSNPLIPIARSEQTRRLADSDSYLLSRGSSASYEMPEPEYDSSEDYRLRSYQPVQYPYQRRNDDLRYSTRPENDVSLETAPVGTINSNNYVESLPSSSSSSRRTYSNYRRPYSARGPTNLGQEQTPKYYRKKNDDSSLEISSLVRSFSEDASREEADSLLSLIEKSFNRRGQNRKYYRKGNSLGADASPIDKLDADEDAVHSQNSQNKRQKYRKEYSDLYNLLVGGLKSRKLTNDSPVTRGFNRKSNGNSRSSLRDESLTDDDKTGQLTFLRLSSLEDLNLESPLLRSHDQNGLNNRKSNSRNFLRLSLSPTNKLTHDEGIASDLSGLLSETLGELNLIPVSLRRTGPSSNKYSRRENRLSAEEDDLINPSDLRLGSLHILNSEFPIRKDSEPAYRSSNKKNLRWHGNNTAAQNKQFDEDTAKTLVPYHEGNRKTLPNSRTNGNQNNNKRDFSDEFSLDTLFDFRKEDYNDRPNLDDNLSNDLSVLSSINQDNLSLKSSLLRNSDKNESNSTTDLLNLEYHWMDVLSPKNKTKGLGSQTQLRNGEKKDKTKNSTEILQLEFPWTDVLSPSKNKTGGLRSLTQLRNGEQDKTKDSSDPLHLEFPWNDVLSLGSNKSGKSKSNLNSPKQKEEAKDTTDTLHLEFPWNNELSPDNKKSSKQSVTPGLRSKSPLRSPKQKDDKKDTTDVLHLEYPWNDQLSPDNNNSKQLSHDQEDNVKDTTDVLRLEFPWNDELSSDENKNGKSKSLRLQTDSRQNKEPKDEQQLELPKPSRKKTAFRTPDPFYVHPYLRNRNIKKHPNYFIRSYDEFSEGVRLENYKNSPLKRSNSSSRRSNRRLMDSKNLRVLPVVRARPENHEIFFKDLDSVEGPSVVITVPSDTVHKRFRVGTRRPNNKTPPLVTTETPNNTLVKNKSDKKAKNNTILFPKN